MVGLLVRKSDFWVQLSFGAPPEDERVLEEAVLTAETSRLHNDLVLVFRHQEDDGVHWGLEFLLRRGEIDRAEVHLSVRGLGIRARGPMSTVYEDGKILIEQSTIGEQARQPEESDDYLVSRLVIRFGKKSTSYRRFTTTSPELVVV